MVRVQHLDFPTKEVFKSFVEISPKELVLQAAQRQKYIDQSQSLNLMIDPSYQLKISISCTYTLGRKELKLYTINLVKSSAQAF